METTLRQILNIEYGIPGADIKKLFGYANVNYEVRTKEGRYVLKQYHEKEDLIAILLAENKVLNLLSNQLPGGFQEPVKTKDGAEFFSLKSDNTNLIFRLLRFLEGELLADVEHTPELFESSGRFLAEMDNVLLLHRDPTIEARQYEWDILQIDMTRDLASYIQNPSDRKLVEYYYQQYHQFVRPLLPGMRKSIIHSDANDLNIIVKDNQVSGLIDFGDVVHSLLPDELAIAITYSILWKEDPLQWALPIIKGYCDVLPLTSEEVDILYYLIAARLCIMVSKSAQGKVLEPENEYLSISEKPAWDLLHKWIAINPVKAKQVFREAAALPGHPVADISDDLRKRWLHVSKSLSVSYQEPIKMGKAAFQYMYDRHGHTYLDARNNIPHVGHCHPQVTAASQKMMHTLNTNTRYIYDELNDYAECLLAKFPDPLNKVFFVNSGSAASDLALRLAFAHTAKEKIVVMEHGYHGNTSLAIDISHYKYDGKGGKGQGENIIMAPLPDTYRGQFQTDDGSAGKSYAMQLIDMMQEHDDNIAAFIAEPIIGCAGQIPLPEAYLNEIYPFIRKQGGVCISDEVQTGFGRLGEVFWGFELFDVVPDIVILGKPIGNGHPMAAVVTTDEISDSFDKGMEFFSSFGGNPVSCAIGMAVLNVIEEEKLQQNALNVGNYLRKELNELKNNHPCIGDVRGNGLFLGIEFVNDPETKDPATELTGLISNELKNRFVMVGTDGPFENVLKIKPPLCFTRENADQLVEALDATLSIL
ncbi:MAG: aminotransferase class III-fold pyridoxal phosphate-dependent enzyme [Bacteroidota bacterium]|nr:aminotransferase class III-fold pyridoxal phosphate-dependent enzyme [Bacteroidota bacterium]